MGFISFTVHRGKVEHSGPASEVAKTRACIRSFDRCGDTGLPQAAVKPATIRPDYTHYIPMSLVLRNKKFLEHDVSSDGIYVQWTQSLGRAR
jgi:hypothetical protein